MTIHRSDAQSSPHHGPELKVAALPIAQMGTWERGRVALLEHLIWGAVMYPLALTEVSMQTMEHAV